MCLMMGFILAVFGLIVAGSIVQPEDTVSIGSTVMAGAMCGAVPFFRDPSAGEGGNATAEQKFLAKVKDECTKAFKTLIDENADFKSIKDLKEKLDKATTADEVTKLKEQIDELGLKMKSIMEDPKRAQKAQTLAEAFVEAYKKAAEGGKLYKVSASGEVEPTFSKGSFEKLDVKAAGTMTTANITPVGTNAIPFTLAEYELGLTRVVRRMPFIQQLVNVGRTIKKFIQWAEQANPDPGTAGMTGEGAAKTQTDFDIVEKSAEVKKITAYIKVSKEMLDDVSFMQAEINNELIEILRLKLDEQILLGDNTGNNMQGILEYAQAFNAGSLADTVPGANNFDVIRVAINQIETATPNGPFIPNYIVMHPTDVAAMDLTKDSEDRYVLPPFITIGGNTIKGLPIIANIGMTEGEFLVGDFTKSNVRMREDATLSVGWENDDFTKNLVTILGEIRAVHYVKSNHVKAFVTGSFAAAKVALDPALT